MTKRIKERLEINIDCIENSIKLIQKKKENSIKQLFEKVKQNLTQPWSFPTTTSLLKFHIDFVVITGKPRDDNINLDSYPLNLQRIRHGLVFL